MLRRALRTSGERSTYDVLRMAHLAVRPLREGLDERSAGQAARAIRQLLDVGAVSITDTERMLAYTGLGVRHHGGGDDRVWELARSAASSGRTQSARTGVVCTDPDCPVGEAAAIPVKVGNDVVGTVVLLRLVGHEITLGMLRAAREVAREIGVQLALAESDRTRQELAKAQTVALRTQISPHFAYNTLTAAASLVRRDPERARDLLVQFAEFSRYILRIDRINTTLAEELRNVHTYLDLERVRHEDRLEVVFRVDPGVLPVVVPMLILQPLVENAVQHGIEGSDEQGVVTIVAEDRDEEVYVAVMDTGVGMDRSTLDGLLDGQRDGDSEERTHVGIANTHQRLQTTYGERYRLSIDSTPGEGTTVSFCVPKFRAGVKA